MNWREKTLKEEIKKDNNNMINPWTNFLDEYN